jgi:glycosyltransferase involved in cell wall biosynthesis
MCIKHSTKVIAISEYIKKTVIEYYNIPDNKVDVVYNAVNIKKFDTPIHQTTDKIMFVFVGRIVKVKGVQIALEALSKLPDYISWEFNIVGDGPYCHELEQKAKALGISDKVVFWGNRNDVPLILADMDIFLHVCTWEEGFGIGIIEAMAAGKLCICSNSGAIPEIITDKINGYLIEKNNVDQLDELLNDTIKNQKNWRTIQLEAKKTANKFGADKFAHELDELLSECRYEIYDSEQIQLK